MKRRDMIALGLAFGPAASLLATPAIAQQPYPSRPIRVIVPIAAGGGTDILIRMIAPKAAALLGAPLVIDNRAGAEGTIGTEVMVRAPPDGYTLLFSDSSLYLNKITRANMPFDPMTDLLPVTRAALGSLILFGGAAFGVRDLRGLIARAGANTGSVTYGTGSTGAYLLGELFKMRTGIAMEHVPYRGGAQAVTDTISGHISMTFNGASIGKPFVLSGELLGIGSTGDRRNAALPDILTFGKQGFPGFPAASEWGLFAPKALPAVIASQVHAAFREALFDPTIQQRLADLGFTPDGADGATYLAEKVPEMQLWADVAASAGLVPR